MSTLTITRPAPPTRAVEVPASPNRALAIVRIGLGLTMLWAFLDKAFALGFSTGRQDDGTIQFFGDAAWINGGRQRSGS